MEKASPADSGLEGSDAATAALAELLSAREEGRKANLACAFIHAHPDDESVGASALLRIPRDCLFLSATDGAPRDGSDATARGFPSWREYAARRRSEWQEVISLSGARPAKGLMMGIADQQASLFLIALTARLVDFLRRARPDAVLTHPYEGGHPDHDAVSFCVRAARRLLARAGDAFPALIESAFYHAGPRGIEALEFLPAREGETERDARMIELTAEERDFKGRLFACYGSQRSTLSWFPLTVERFRPAPPVDFSRSPHDGPLFYEAYPWGMTGIRFRNLVGDAARTLGTGTLL